MHTYCKQFIQMALVCLAGVSLLTSCYTVKGAFQGAGKDVAVLVGQDEHHHVSKSSHAAKPHSATSSQSSSSQGMTTSAKKVSTPGQKAPTTSQPVSNAPAHY